MAASPEALARRFYDEVLNAGNVDLVDELCADDYVEHEEAFPGMPQNREGVKQFVQMMRAAFPDLRMTLESVLSDEERVMCRFRMTGTHEGEFMDIPATGRKIEMRGYDEARIVDGRAVEHWGAMDGIELMRQLGVAPEVAQTA